MLCGVSFVGGGGGGGGKKKKKKKSKTKIKKIFLNFL